MLRDELNKAFYKDRLVELEVEAEEGLVDNQQELIDDLKQSLLDDVPAQEEMKKTQISTVGWAHFKVNQWVAIADYI